MAWRAISGEQKEVEVKLRDRKSNNIVCFKKIKRWYLKCLVEKY